MNHLKSLFEKYKNNDISPQEMHNLLDYIAVENEDEVLGDWIDEALNGEVEDTAELRLSIDQVYNSLQRRIVKESGAVERKINWKPVKWLAVAASVIVTVGSVLYVYDNFSEKNLNDKNHYANDLAPGGNKAILTLANGRKIILDDSTQAELINTHGIHVTKTKDGQLTYTVTGDQNDRSEKMEYNTAETPKGGQYRINLSDGTMVILNAASSLKYPTTFKGRERVVEITGEGYFEVAKDKKHPFVVKTAKQSVEVLGTHFNINSYKDEPAINTTLFEGSVRIDGNTVLKPGEQASLYKTGQLLVSKGSEDVIAWKNGKFKFEDTSVEAILRQFARWYDVDIEYPNGIPRERFTGYIDRNLNASDALNILRYTKIDFRIEGKRIIVLK